LPAIVVENEVDISSEAALAAAPPPPPPWPPELLAGAAGLDAAALVGVLAVVDDGTDVLALGLDRNAGFNSGVAEVLDTDEINMEVPPHRADDRAGVVIGSSRQPR